MCRQEQMETMMKVFQLLPLLFVEHFVTVYSNDFCETGWDHYGGSCYYFSTDTLSWNDAKERCRTKGGKLAEMNDENENQFVANNMGAHGHSVSYFGISDVATEGTWIGEISANPINYENWGNGQPDGGLGQNYGVFYGNGWDDGDGGTPAKYICEKEACEDNWLRYGDSCYFFSTELIDWNSAKEKCGEADSKLVEINDIDENGFVASHKTQHEAFIGISDAEEEGTWIGEVSGQPITYTNWNPSNPDNHGGDQHCGVLAGNSWDDNHCGGPFMYICEKTDYCDQNPCSNGGVCTDQGTGYTCSCINGYIGTNCETAAFSVESCTMQTVNYTVISGVTSGITYVQGSMESCTRSLSGSPSESFSISYAECGLSPALDQTNSIEITIVVQDKADITSEDDDFYTIKCTFGENKNVEVAFEAQGKRKDETNDVNVEVFPNPRMIIYWLDVQSGNFEELSDETVVVLGDFLRQEITLDNSVPNYKVRVKTCSMKAKTLEDVLLKELPLLDDVTSCSVLGTTYPDVTYSTTDGSPIARVDFKAFLPTLPDVDLSQGVKIEMKCTVSVCFGANSVCDEPSCGARRRKRRGKRAVEKNPTIRNYEDLSEGFIIKYENKSDLSNVKINTHVSSEQSATSLIESTQFWAIIISALVVLVLAALITFCIVKYLRKQKAVTNKGLCDDRMSTKMSDLQFSGRDSWSTSVRGPYYGCDSCSNHLCDPRMAHNGSCRREPPPDYNARPEPHNTIGKQHHDYRY